MEKSKKKRMIPLVNRNFIILAVLVSVFFGGWFLVTKSRNDLFGYNIFYRKGIFAQYEISGPLSQSLGTNRMYLDIIKSEKNKSIVKISAGKRVELFNIDPATSKIIDGKYKKSSLSLHYKTIYIGILPNSYDKYVKDGKLNMELIVPFYDGEKPMLFTPSSFSQTDIVYYDDVYGPQWSYKLFNKENGNIKGYLITDQTSGLLLDGEIYDSKGASKLHLLNTNYSTSLNRWVIFYGLNIIIFFWGIWHILTLKRHPEAQYFKMNLSNYIKFFIRIMCFTTFDVLGQAILTGNLTFHMIADGIGFLLMLYAVGPFAFMILFKFIALIPGVQYPYGVPLYLCAVIAYELRQAYIIALARRGKIIKT